MDLKKSKVLNKLNSRQKLIFDRLKLFFTKDKIETLTSILNGKSKISLRIVDWFVTNYTKKNNIIIYNKKKKPIYTKSPTNLDIIKSKKTKYKEVVEQFNIYLNYKSQLKAYSKKNFDPFCRRERIDFHYGESKFIVTTIGQLNFFRWAIQNNVIVYIDKHLDTIEKDMNLNIKRQDSTLKKSKKKKLDDKLVKSPSPVSSIGSNVSSCSNESYCSTEDNLSDDNITNIKKRRKRRELSTSANNKLKKHKFSITLEFE